MTRYDIARMYGYNSVEEYDEAEKRKHELYTESLKRQKPYVEKEPVKIQPVDRWISVDEALPIYEGLVLAVDNNNTIRLGIYTDLGWMSQFGNSMVAHITHWMPLPQPPKEE